MQYWDEFSLVSSNYHRCSQSDRLMPATVKIFALFCGLQQPHRCVTDLLNSGILRFGKTCHFHLFYLTYTVKSPVWLVQLCK